MCFPTSCVRGNGLFAPLIPVADESVMSGPCHFEHLLANSASPRQLPIITFLIKESCCHGGPPKGLAAQVDARTALSWTSVFLENVVCDPHYVKKQKSNTA